ncbi:MAG: OmpA family protein [Flavobacteriales bacterium]
MKKSILLTLAIIVLFQLSSIAQKQATVLLFDYKKSTLTKQHKEELQKLFDQFRTDSIGVNIDAYCDSIGGPVYNVGLGQQRAISVKQFFLDKKVKRANISLTNHGISNPVASNATEEGRRINRRVVVEIWSMKKGAVKDLPKLNEDSIKAALIKQYCKLDTTVELPNGVFIKLNRCEFEKIKNCVSIASFSSPAMLRKSGYTTMGPEFSTLNSVGVVDVKLCSDSCLVSPLKVYIPVTESCQGNQEFNVWKGYSDMYWRNSGEVAKRVSMNGKEYFELATTCSASMNIAVQSKENVKFTFKAKKGLKFTEIRVSYECAMGIYTWTSEKPVKKAKMMLPCPKKDVSFEVYGVTKDGQIVRMDYAPASSVKSKGKQKSCAGKAVPKKFYLLPANFKL